MEKILCKPFELIILALFCIITHRSLLKVNDLYISDHDIEKDDYYTVKKNNMYISLPKYIYDNDYSQREITKPNIRIPQINVISSGNYTIVMNSKGESYSKYGNLLKSPVYKRNCLQTIHTKGLTYWQKYAVKNSFKELTTYINETLAISL